MTAFLARKRDGRWLISFDDPKHFLVWGRVPEADRPLMTSANILNPHAAVGDDALGFPNDTVREIGAYCDTAEEP